MRSSSSARSSEKVLAASLHGHYDPSHLLVRNTPRYPGTAYCRDVVCMGKVDYKQAAPVTVTIKVPVFYHTGNGVSIVFVIPQRVNYCIDKQ